MSEPVISIKGLRKSYGDLEAIKGIDLELEREEILAVLGPNGAGKTTTVEILEGFRDRDVGEVSVLGCDPANAPGSWRERIGMVLQGTSLEPKLTVRESLELYGGYFSHPRPVNEVIALVGLEEKADVRAGRLSGGQLRRLDVGIALIGDPELLFLDEPTTGFDPSARRMAWEMIAGLRDLGKSVLLTTHYMDEAQFLADRVAIISEGRLVAEDSPENLGNRDNLPTKISFRIPIAFIGRDLAGLGPVSFGDQTSRDCLATIDSENPVIDLNRLTAWAMESGVELAGLEVRRPSLEDIYLEMTAS